MNQLFIVGAQRSGTTYLYKMLDAHPEIFMAKPVRPEPKFFLNEDLYSQGRNLYEQRYFSTCLKEHKYIGEKSTSYIESMQAAERISQYYPNARILIILRNPALRAWSNYCFSVDNGIEQLDFASALLAEKDRLSNSKYKTSVNPYAYCNRGYYFNYIDAYASFFKKSQVRVIIFEEMVGRLKEVQDLYLWLGVKNNFNPMGLGDVYNSSVSQGNMPKSFYYSMMQGYKESIERLEEYLGRKINVWEKK